MARMPLRPCKHAGCGVLTRDGWCDKHRPRDRRKASAEYHGWYMLPIWTDRLRPEQLLREPFCRECARLYAEDDPRRRTPATVVDHVVPHRGDWAIFTDASNLQSLCKRHHDKKTAQELRETRRF